MPISRRQFFRGLMNSERKEKERKGRMAALDSYLRNALLPYDFMLDPNQTAALFAEIQARVAELEDEGLHSPRVSAVMEDITASLIQPWRHAHWKADEIRQAAAEYITEFLAVEATAEDLDRLRNRFNIPYPTVVEDEVSRHARQWLENLADSRLLEFDDKTVRELIFSELRSWC